MADLKLTVACWSAWMPGLASLSDWQQYFATQTLDLAQSSPALPFVEPMLRRRLSRLSRMLLAVAKPCVDPANGEHRLIFANQHGELATTVQLLQALAQNETPSPMGFSLSVHNSAAGLYSIACQDRAAATAIAAGEKTLSSALIEAYAQLRNGAESVTVAYAEEPLPTVYRAFERAQTPCLALGLCLTRASEQGFLLNPTTSNSALDLIHVLTQQAAKRYALLA